MLNVLMSVCRAVQAVCWFVIAACLVLILAFKLIDIVSVSRTHRKLYTAWLKGHRAAMSKESYGPYQFDMDDYFNALCEEDEIGMPVEDAVLKSRVEEAAKRPQEMRLLIRDDCMRDFFRKYHADGKEAE